MTKEYKSTWVEADPKLPALYAPQTIDIEHNSADPEAIYSKTPLRTHINTDPVMAARAFLVKYAGLSVILAILAIGLTWTLQWHLSVGIVTFALLCIVGYGGLAAIDHRHTGPGVERHRLTLATTVMMAHIEAQEHIHYPSYSLYFQRYS